MWVRSLALEEGMATCSGILAWRIPWTEEAGGLQLMGLPRVRHGGAHTHMTLSIAIIMSKKREMEDESMTLKKHVTATNTTL